MIITIAFLDGSGAVGQGVASIQNVSSTPFVTGITPVIGANGAVGGVLVDANGVVGCVEPIELSAFRRRWQRSTDFIDGENPAESDLRVISLTRLDRALGGRLQAGKPITPEMIFLAGLRRVEYVIAVPESNELLLAGPGGPWMANAAGEVVGVQDRRAVLRLDDLMDAIRVARHGNGHRIRCSIEPTPAGMQRYAKLRSRIRRFDPSAVRAMEHAIGMQPIMIEGIESDSHFARVLVSADYMMKRLAMGFESSPLESIPSYLTLLKKHSPAGQLSSPRWWMQTDYAPLRCTPDRLTWQIRGPGVQTRTQDSKLADDGTRQILEQENRLAMAWADAMTSNYDVLALSLPIFGELRNCFDLAVVGALIASEGLAVRTDVHFDVLTDADRLRGPRLPTPLSVPSMASGIKTPNGWIVSVSGGVELDAWSVVQESVIDDRLDAIRRRALPANIDRWWWSVPIP